MANKIQFKLGDHKRELTALLLLVLTTVLSLAEPFNHQNSSTQATSLNETAAKSGRTKTGKRHFANRGRSKRKPPAGLSSPMPAATLTPTPGAIATLTPAPNATRSATPTVTPTPAPAPTSDDKKGETPYSVEVGLNGFKISGFGPVVTVLLMLLLIVIYSGLFVGYLWFVKKVEGSPKLYKTAVALPLIVIAALLLMWLIGLKTSLDVATRQTNTNQTSPLTPYYKPSPFTQAVNPTGPSPIPELTASPGPTGTPSPSLSPPPVSPLPVSDRGWQTAANISTVAQAVLLIASLVLIVIQLKKQTDLARISNTQSLVSLVSPFNLEVAQDPNLARLWTISEKEWDHLSDVEKQQYESMLRWWFIFYENLFFQYESKLLNDQIFSGWKKDLDVFVEEQLVEKYWQSLSKKYHQNFVEYLDSRVAAKMEEKRSSADSATKQE